MLFAEPVFLQAAPRLLASALATGLAVVAARRWVSAKGMGAPRDVRFTAIVVVTAASLIGTGILLGAIGVLHDWSWALAVAAVSVAMLRVPLQARAPAGPPAETPSDRPSFLFAAAVLGIVIGRALYGLRNPPSDVDSLHYHLPMVGNWIASAGLGVPLREPPATSEGYPGNGQLLQLWAAWSTGRETLMSWMGTLLIGVLAVALRRLGMDFGARRGIAESAALGLTATPGVLQLTFGMRIDNMLAAFFAVAIVHALRWRRLGRPFDRDVLLLAVGLVAGLKGTAPAHAALVASLGVAAPGVRNRIRALLRPSLPLLAALVCGGFWVVRNLVATGNPLYPAELKFGPVSLPGPLSREFLLGTTQIEIWRQGYPGNLAPENLWNFYATGMVALALGLTAWAVSRVMLLRRLPSASRDTGVQEDRFVADEASAPLLVSMAVVCLGLYVISPYSGAFMPAEGGNPPRFAVDNVRYLWPGLVAAFPVAALGLSRLPLAWLWPPAFVLLTAALLFRMSGHLAPGLVLAVAVLGAWRLWRGMSVGARARIAIAAGAVGCLVLATAVALVDPGREKLNDYIWDTRHKDGTGLDAAAFRTVRTISAGRRIALVGDVDTWWICYGRDFSGRPTYVPTSIEWRPNVSEFALLKDDRARPDTTRWRDNLDRAAAAAIVIGAEDQACRIQPIEARWIASDGLCFQPIAGNPCASAYEVKPANAASR